MANKQTVFSGIQPTGALHIGNYLGAIKQWLELQKTHNCIFCIVDYHAITVPYNPKQMQQKILDTAIDYFALGLDPKKSTVFIQSHVPEHTELAWLLNTVTNISELERMTQFKDKTDQHSSISAGLLNYPVLMAADILLYKANLVPVGEDQKQHVELTRTIARKFNTAFGDTLAVPEVKLAETKRIMSLSDPAKKMSKSLGPKHYLALTDSPDVIREKISKAVTGVGDEKELPAGAVNLLMLLKEFGTEKEYNQFEQAANKGSVKYSELKNTLAEAIIKKLKPFHDKRAVLASNPSKIWKTLDEGAKKARPIAKKTLKEVKQKMGLI